MVDRSRYATGRVGPLLFLFLPLAATALSNCLYLFVEKIFLARLSTLEMEAAVNASYAWQIFQGPAVALALSASIYLGRSWGAQEYQGIGPAVWQFIWFCLLSMLVILPCGIIFGNYYFSGTEIEAIVFPYYYFHLGINFLFPLIACLSCFYIVQGKTRMVLCATLISQIIKICLAYVLILGWDPWISGIGLMGGALSTCIAQMGLCLTFLTVFLSRKNAQIFHSRKWHFQIGLFWVCIQPGLTRAFCRLSTFLCGAATAHLMTAKGGEYLLTLSIGGTLFFFFPFIADAIFQAQTTIVSQFLGMRQYHLLHRASNSAFLLSGIMIGILAIPFLLFPTNTFHYLFPTIDLAPDALRNIFLGSWLSFAFYTLVFVPISHVLAFKDAKFFLFMGAFNWINGYLLMYIAVKKIGIVADQYWLVISLMHVSTFFLYYWRMRWLQNKERPLPMLEALVA